MWVEQLQSLLAHNRRALTLGLNVTLGGVDVRVADEARDSSRSMSPEAYRFVITDRRPSWLAMCRGSRPIAEAALRMARSTCDRWTGLPAAFVNTRSSRSPWYSTIGHATPAFSCSARWFTCCLRRSSTTVGPSSWRPAVHAVLVGPSISRCGPHTLPLAGA